jgi:deoxycytidylate deaminase
LIGYGVNKIIKNIPKSNLVYSTVGADKHPAKNFLMFHAEMDLVFKFHDMSEEQKRRTKIYASLQPCLNCLKTLINFGFTDVEWMTDNRHQDDQKMIEPYTHLIKYKKNEEGYAVQIPRWIVHEEEIEKHFRDHRQPKDEEVL